MQSFTHADEINAIQVEVKSENDIANINNQHKKKEVKLNIKKLFNTPSYHLFIYNSFTIFIYILNKIYLYLFFIVLVVLSELLYFIFHRLLFL